MSPCHSSPSKPRRQAGLTLVELVVAILIVTVAIAGIVSALSVAYRYNADPLVRKQALAIAESLLEEVSSRAYTDLDLHNPEAAIPNVIGPEAVTGESRTSPTLGFDNVDDYDGYSQIDVVTDASGNAWPVSGHYATCVTVQNPSNAIAGVPANEVLLIAVSVFGPGSQVFAGNCNANAMAAASPLVRLQAYRMKYDPSS